MSREDASLTDLARGVVPTLADACAVHLVRGAGGFELAVLEHQDPAWCAKIQEIVRRWPIRRGSVRGAAAAFHAMEPLLVPRLPAALLLSYAVDEAHGRALVDLGLSSAIVVPIVVEGQPRGTITLLAVESKREYGDAEVELARSLGARAATILARAGSDAPA